MDEYKLMRIIRGYPHPHILRIRIAKNPHSTGSSVDTNGVDEDMNTDMGNHIKCGHRYGYPHILLISINYN